MSLRTKLIGFGLIFAILPLMIAMLPSISRFQTIQTKSAIEHEQQIADAATQEINHFLELQYKSLQEASLLWSDVMQRKPEGELFLERILFKNDFFVDIAAVNSDGEEIVRKNKHRVITEDDLNNRSNSEAFRALETEDIYMGDLYFEQGRPFFIISSVVRDARGNRRGAVIAEVDARILQEVVRDTTVAKSGGRTYIVNEDGDVIAHPNISTVLSKTSFSSVPIVQNIMESPSTRFEKEYDNENGEEVLGAWSKAVVPSNEDVATGWYVISEEKVRYALQHVKEMRWFSLGALIAVVLMVLPAVLFITNQILNPIKKVHRFVGRVAEGDYSKKVSVRVNDEIGEMAKGVNEMVESVKKARERDKLVSRMKSEFLSIAAHQLRTPLSTLKWTFNALLEDDAESVTQKQEKFLKRGLETNERVIELVNDLLNASQIEEGKFGYEFDEISLGDIVETVVKEEEIRAKQKDLRLTFHQPDSSLSKVRADKDKMYMAVSNLVDNAITYTHSGGTIDVFLEEREGNVRFKIQDTGIGLDEDSQGRLFTKFYRGDEASKIKTEGSGLGLFLVKNIIDAHDGDVWVDSTKDEGTTFYFTIPIAA